MGAFRPALAPLGLQSPKKAVPAKRQSPGPASSVYFTKDTSDRSPLSASKRAKHVNTDPDPSLDNTILPDSENERNNRPASTTSRLSQKSTEVWLPEPECSEHLDEMSLNALRAELEGYMDQKIDIMSQIMEISETGARKSSKGLDTKFLKHNMSFIDERIAEFKAEISRRSMEDSTGSPYLDHANSDLRKPVLPSHTPTIDGMSKYAASSGTKPHVTPSESSKSSSTHLHSPANRQPKRRIVPDEEMTPLANRALSSKTNSFRPAGTSAPLNISVADSNLSDSTSLSVVFPPNVTNPPADAKLGESSTSSVVILSTKEMDALCQDVDFDDLDFDDSFETERQATSNIIDLDFDEEDEEDDEPILAPKRTLSDSVTVIRPKSKGRHQEDGLAEGLPAIIYPDTTSYPWSKDVDKALRQRFKLVGFRKNQQEAINGTLSGRDTFVLLPTGGGKSLCFQLPAVVQSGKTKGVTVVISPLLSLMEDQCRALIEKDIPVVSVNSTMPAASRNYAMSVLRMNPPNCHLVYLTPEQIVNSNAMKSILQDLHRRQQLARFVLDEAHCVSAWGHDFRPDYKAMVSLKTDYPGVPLLALTATASKRVQKDVISNLNMSNPLILTSSFNRANLQYEVRQKTKGIIQDIVKFISTPNLKGKTGIIYCFSQKSCEDTALKLREVKINARHYHAGMTASERSIIQEGWQKDEFQVICATIAFGMGIDKPDVRYVIHYSIPKNLEGYYQETGRAGRDGKKSWCLLFYSFADKAAIEHLIDQGDGAREQKDHNKECLRLVIQYCVNQSDCRRKQVLHYFNEIFDPADCHKSCDNCLHAGTMERKDVTELAKKAIQLVKEFDGQKVTLVTAVDIFRGSKSQKVTSRGFDQFEGAGEGRNVNREDVERLFQILAAENVFGESYERSPVGYTHAYIKVGPKYRDVLGDRLKIFMDVTDGKRINEANKQTKQADQISTTSAETRKTARTRAHMVDGISTPYEKALEARSRKQRSTNSTEAPDAISLALNDLKKLRKKLATQAKVPPDEFVDDFILDLLSVTRPTTFASFVRLEGCTEELYDSFFSKGAKDICNKYAGEGASTSKHNQAIPSTSKEPTTRIRKMPTSKADTVNMLRTFTYSGAGTGSAKSIKSSKGPKSNTTTSSSGIRPMTISKNRL